MTNFTFAELFKGFLKREGITQKRFAEMINRPRSTIGYWCSGKYLPRDDYTLDEIINALTLTEEEENELRLAGKGITPEQIKQEIQSSSIGSLPRKPKYLFGRDEDLDWIKERLTTSGQAAIAGVRGIGGIGKTALAIVAAHQLHEAKAFAGGVLWVECGPYGVAQ